ncbi:MAG: hypothetical protein ACJAWW_001510 [Sulfurimonas sp.]|jgi:hypothetical protein
MQNPFETGHIKNYILLYTSVVVIMVLFFIASTLFRDDEVIKKKVFSTENSSKIVPVENEDEKKVSQTSKIKLMDKVY